MITDLKDLSVSLEKEEESLLDLDHLAEKLAGLTGEVEAYRQSLLRHIKTRCDLLEKPLVLGVETMTTQQLLDTKDALDREFRERFRIKQELFQPRDPASFDLERHTAFVSGK